MGKDPFFDQSRSLLRAFDFSAELAAREEAHSREMSCLLMRLLDLVDSFDRYLGVPRVKSSREKGDEQATPRLIARQLERVLEQSGVTSVLCLGQPFDPERHELVGMREDTASAAGIIIEVLSRGFDWTGRLLRRPRVIIAQELKETGP